MCLLSKDLRDANKLQSPFCKSNDIDPSFFTQRVHTKDKSCITPKHSSYFFIYFAEEIIEQFYTLLFVFTLCYITLVIYSIPTKINIEFNWSHRGNTFLNKGFDFTSDICT